MATGTWRPTGLEACRVIGADDLSLYGSLSEDELLRMAIEQSLTDMTMSSQKSTTTDSDTHQTSVENLKPPVIQGNTPVADKNSTTTNLQKDGGAETPSGVGCRGPQWRSLQRLLEMQHKEAKNPISVAIMEDDSTSLQNILDANMDLNNPSVLGVLPIHEAAFLGKKHCLKLLIQACPKQVNRRSFHNETPLYMATSQGHVECMRLLLEARAMPDLRTPWKEQPLYKACEINNHSAALLLIRYGANVNAHGNHGHTPLFEAISKNNKKIVQLLVDSGANVEVKNKYGLCPVFLAAECGRLDILKYLLRHGGLKDTDAQDGATVLYEASKNEHKDVVEHLLDIGVSANKYTRDQLLPLHIAAAKGNDSIVEMLLPVTDMALVKQSGISPMHLAAQGEHSSVLSLLIAHGFDVNVVLSAERSRLYADRRSTPLFFAVANGDDESARILLEAGANPEQDVLRPLLVAVRLQHIPLVHLLLSHGAELQPSIPTLPTAFPTSIFFAAGSIKMMRLLLNWGADAESCFWCFYGASPHPALPEKKKHHWPSDELREWPGFPRAMQFCDFLADEVAYFAGPVVSALLDYVGSVRLCARVREILDCFPDGTAIRETAENPRPLTHICRIAIRRIIGPRRLGFIQHLPVPPPICNFLRFLTTN
uniref:ankyrin repeat and SOCS box protein 2-like n=1 Tax=Myxine glutinosa TaxID=7769 RepID=UPI00358EDF56